MPNNDKTIKYFFTKLYNGGHLTELIIPSERIKQLDELYKTKHDKYLLFEDFENAFPLEFLDFTKSKSAYQEIKKQFLAQKGLQPCILTECFVAQTIANNLNLNQYIDLDDNPNVPAQLISTIFSAQGYSDGSTFRYCYYNDHFDALVFQCGASGTVDVVFTKYNLSIRIEVKEQTSKLEECDITGLYDENGHLIVSHKFQSERLKYVPYVLMFNALTNVFDMEGHNFKISQYLTDNKVKDIISDALDIKVVDVFILVVNNKLVPVLSKYLFDFVTFEGSEIRTAGRNYGKVFTPNFAKQKIISMGGTIDELGNVNMPYDPSLRVKGRGLDIYNRYGIGSLLFVKLENTQIIDDRIYFKFEDVCQKKPSISIHLNSTINNYSLIEQFRMLENMIN